jgi:excinuclease UvrABC nuclease subunit
LPQLVVIDGGKGQLHAALNVFDRLGLRGKLASVAAVNIEEAGTTAAATALCVVIVVTSAAVKALHLLADRFLLRRVQAWRRR